MSPVKQPEWHTGYRMVDGVLTEVEEATISKADFDLLPWDNQEFNATDGAHPAWWRGHDYTALVFCQLVHKILDGQDDGRGFNIEPWATLRRRLLALIRGKENA